MGRGKMEAGRIIVSDDLLEAAGFEDGQQLRIYAAEGRLVMEPASEDQAPPTADQLLAHEIADSFSTLEEILVFMSAVVDVKNRISPGDAEKAKQIGAEIEKSFSESETREGFEDGRRLFAVSFFYARGFGHHFDDKSVNAVETK